MKRNNKVLDRPDLIRDPDSSAILNIDNEALAGYKKRKNQQRIISIMEQDQKDMKDEISQLKSDINIIKGSLDSILSILTTKEK